MRGRERKSVSDRWREEEIDKKNSHTRETKWIVKNRRIDMWIGRQGDRFIFI